jgi:adenylate cyclase
MITSLDLLNRLLEHRLHQADIEEILKALPVRDREDFREKVSGILSKISALLEVSNRVSDTLYLDELLERIIETSTEAINADRGSLFLNDPETGELYSKVAMGGIKKEIRFPNNMGIAGEVFSTGKGIIINDAYADPRFNPEVDRQTGYRTRNILCSPIRAISRGNETIGVIQLLNKKSGVFTENDLWLLGAFTSQSASALLKAQLFEEVQKAREEEQQMLEVTTAVSTELRLRPLLKKIMETTTDLLDADRSTLFINDEKTDELWSQVAEGIGGEIRFPNHLGIAGTVFKTGETINIPDAYADPRFNPEVDKKTGYRTTSILCMPVINKEGKIIGVTQVLNKKGGPFTEKDVKRLRAFTSQVSVALENAKLFDEVENLMNYNESMLESMSNGVLTLDDENVVVKYNSAFLKLFRVDHDAVMHRKAEEVFTGENSWILEKIEKVVRTEKPDVTMDADLRLGTGERISANLTVVPLVSVKHEESSIGSMLIFEDITSEKRIKSTMARYMSKEVAEKVLESGEYMLGGQVNEATVLFSDIRRFTTLTEKLGAQETVSMLNEFFSLMVDIIIREGGILDKYIGDAIMAVFGTPFPTEEDADKAVRSGIEMLKALDGLNRKRMAAGQMVIEIGIGINTDEIVSGNIGSMKRMDYTVIGDGVNLASRLEGVTKYYGAKLLVSESTFTRLKGDYISREIDLIRVKGKTKPVGVYEILDHHTEETFPHLNEVVPLFREGISFYREQLWHKALERFKEALRLNPGDRPLQTYISRCMHFIENPPGENWDGVWVMEVK